MKKLSTLFVLPVLMGFLLAGSAALMPAPAFAQGNVPPPADSNNISISFKLKNPLGSDTADLNTFLQNILKAIVMLITPVVVIMMIYSGFLFVTARGAAEELTKAKQALLYTLIGAAIVLGAQGIATLLKNTITCIAGSPGC